MSIYYALNYRKKMLPIIFAMIAVFILTSGSKGFIFVALISILLMLIVSNIKIRYKILILSLSIVGGIFILGPIFDSLQNDIQNYTSVSTRMYTIGIAIIMMIKYPFGTGNSLYLKMFPQELDLNLRFMQKTQFNLSEINSYIYATNDKNIGVKSGLLQWGMLWGIPGFIFILIYLNNVRKCILNINNKYRNILIFIFINIIIYIKMY